MLYKHCVEHRTIAIYKQIDFPQILQLVILIHSVD